MRTTLKMVLPLIVSVAAGCLLFTAYQVRTERRILRSDLSHRAEILGDSLEESVEPLFDRRPDGSIQRLIEHFGQREHLKGVAVFDASGTTIATTFDVSPQLQSHAAAAIHAASHDLGYGEFVRINQAALHIYSFAGPSRRKNRGHTRGSARH
jgi:hypothetical protein